MGLGREGIAAICEILNMPAPVPPTAWAAYEDELYKQNGIEINEELEQNQTEVKELDQKDNDSDQSVISIPVSFEGTWAKRGFTSNHGVGLVTSFLKP